MLSGVTRRLCRDAGQLVRTFTASSAAFEGEITSSVDSFRSKLAKIAPNIEPMFTSDFLKGATVGPTDGPTPSKLKFSFAMPHGIIMSEQEVRSAGLGPCYRTRCVQIGPGRAQNSHTGK